MNSYQANFKITLPPYLPWSAITPTPVVALQGILDPWSLLQAPVNRIELGDDRGDDRSFEVRLSGEYRLWTTKSGSMVPTIGERHLQVTVEVDPEEIQVGDKLVVRESLRGRIVGHRVVRD